MKLLIDALVGTLYPVVYVLLFASMTCVAFALIGMGMFRGRMHRCTWPGAEYPGGLMECSGFHVSDQGYMVHRAWVNPSANFDTLPRSMLTLFQLNTIKYVSVMHDTMDITGLYTSPSQNYSDYNCLFFVVYLVIGSLFIMNLFVGFIVDGFNSSKGEDSEVELEYTRFLRAVREYAPSFDLYRSPQNRYNRALRYITDSSVFVTISMSGVVVSIIFMLADHKNPDPVFAQVFELQNTILFWVLVGETTLVLLGYGPQGWLNDGWKAFDLFVCVGSAAGVISSRRY